MNVLSLFTGAGGGELAFQHLLDGFKTIGYVEIDDYCQRIIAQRIKDGLLDNAEIYGDIRTFITEGYAEAYQGQVDVITAGFPCQPFSVAGKQLAEKDNRNMWPETIKTIRTVKPSTVFLENVPGLFSNEYITTIFRQLRENGYKALPGLRLGADDIGANHRRKRFWIVAERESNGRIEGKPDKGGRAKRVETGQKYRPGGCGQNVADSPQRQDDGRKRGNVETAPESREGFNSTAYSCCQDVADSSRIYQGRQKPRSERERIGSCCESIDVANATQKLFNGSRNTGQRGRPESANGSQEISNTIESRPQGRRGLEKANQKRQTQGGIRQDLAGCCRNSWWLTEPAVGRVAHGVAHRVDRLKAIGNGQVPQVARIAWEILTEGRV